MHSYQFMGSCSYIWGRGTMDLKFMVIALLEAVNELLKSDW